MEIIDVRKLNKFLQLTGQEDLSFIRKYVFHKELREEIIKDCYLKTTRNFKPEYKSIDYLEALYTECLLYSEFEYPILYENFIESITWFVPNNVLIHKSDEKVYRKIFIKLTSARTTPRKKRDELMVSKFIYDITNSLLRN